jgi:hypothetical protein
MATASISEVRVVAEASMNLSIRSDVGPLHPQRLVLA